MTDWSKTPLGPRELWPSSLKTAVAICEGSPSPMQVWWGPSLVLVYNEATIPLLGDRHPQALGRPAHEAWPELAPAITDALRDAKPVRTELPGLSFALTPVGDGVVSICDLKDRVLAMLGHELRNALAPLVMTAGTLKLTGAAHGDMIDRQVTQLRQVVDGVLDISRLIRGKLQLRPERVELAPLVERAAAINGIVAEVPSGLYIDIDPDRFTRLLAGLLVPGANMNVTAGGGRIQISIAATGVPAELELRLARAVIDLHHGTLTVGKTVLIDLPIEVGAPEPSMRPVRAKRRVLVVDDNDEHARTLHRALEELGYEVAVAHDGPVALTVARTFRPHIALLDIGLPVMDGYELAKRLRDMRVATRELPFVAVTGMDRDTDRERSAKEGFADHLAKPVDLAKLQRVVDELAATARGDG